MAAAATAIGAVALPPRRRTPTARSPCRARAFPDPRPANLSFVGCSGLYQRSAEPLIPTVGVGPGEAPAGTRSLGWDLAGGNAVGAVFPVGSMLTTTTAGMSVNSAGRATGVAYAGYQAPADAGTSLLWVGRARSWSPRAARGRRWMRPRGATTGRSTTCRDPAAGRPRARRLRRPSPRSPPSHGGDGPGGLHDRLRL